MATTRLSKSKVGVIEQVVSIIKSYNPTTHSIDTHCLEILGDVTKPDSDPEKVLIQQLVYGCFKEKPLLKVFIDDLYGDNVAKILRTDITLYTVLAYTCIFRIKELGMRRFREITSQVPPPKLENFLEYLFNKERILELHRASWLRVKDLSYIDTQIIPPLLDNINESIRYRSDLAQTAIEIAAEEAAKADAKSKGQVGLKKIEKKASTRPVSPKLNQTRPPILPQPERIDNTVVAKPVPSVVYSSSSLSEIQQKNSERKEQIKEHVREKYNKNFEFKLNETKYGKKTEELRQELEEDFKKSLDFNRSFYNPPPASISLSAPSSASATGSRTPVPPLGERSEIKQNVSSILREDYLFRKQQKKDAEVLRKYEEELHDTTEFLRWQKEMKDFQEEEKLKMVKMRQYLAKKSSEDAKLSIEKQIKDNGKIGHIMRKKKTLIKEQNEIENSIELLKKKENVQKIIEVRSTLPIIEKKKVFEENISKGEKVREELMSLQREKELEDKQKEIIKFDQIRQLKALNTVHRKHFTIFDPTETSEGDFLDEMSYLEMKERISLNERVRSEEVQHKNEEINTEKNNKKLDLQKRLNQIEKTRSLKAETRQKIRQKSKETQEKERIELETLRQENEKTWNIELQKKTELKRAEMAQLREEEERIKRQQQYLGVAHSQVAAVREKQIEMAKNRQIQAELEEIKKLQEDQQLVEKKEKKNKHVIQKNIKKATDLLNSQRLNEVEFEKSVCVEKLKDMVIYKKSMFLEGQDQHARTRRVVYETNPYATKITIENRTEMLASTAK